MNSIIPESHGGRINILTKSRLPKSWTDEGDKF